MTTLSHIARHAVLHGTTQSGLSRSPRATRPMSILSKSILSMAIVWPAVARADMAPVDNDPAPETVIVVGQRDAPITLVPRGLSVSLGQDDFEAINAINVEDLMKYAPNFFVRKRFAGDDNAVVALRGANTVQSARTIVLVDGFLVSNFLGNSFSFSPKWNVVGPADVRQFDIVYGPYSARYNGNSMGGVVSVTTKEPRQNGAFMTSTVMAMPFKEYGIDETFAGYSLEGGANWVSPDSRLRVRLSGRYFDNVGQSMTYQLLTPATGSAPSTQVAGAFAQAGLSGPVFGAASPPDVVQGQYRLRIGYDVAPGWTLDGLFFGWSTHQKLRDARTFLRDNNGVPIGQGRVRFNDQIWNATGLTLSEFTREEYLAGLKLVGRSHGWDVRANVSRYWMPVWNTKTSRDWLTGQAQGAGTYQVQDKPGWSALDMSLDRTIGRHNLGLGFNSSLYQTAQDTYATSNWRTAANQSFSAATSGKTSSWGIWVEDAYDLSERTTVTLGARYDQWRAFDGAIARQSGAVRLDDTYPVRTDDAFSPKISVQSAIGEGLIVQLSAGTAVRFPTVGELFQGRIDEVTREIDPQSFDPNLRPEKSIDVTLMARAGLGPVRLTSSIFFQDVEDAIFSFSGLNPFGTVVTSFKNVDLVRQYGVEWIAESRDFPIAGLDWNVAISWMDATTKVNRANPETQGNRFPRIPEWRSSGSVRKQISPVLKASLGWRHASTPTSDLFGREGSIYGFQTAYVFVDARLSWDLNEAVRLNFGIDNINNDRAYVSHPMPQRTFVFDVNVTL